MKALSRHYKKSDFISHYIVLLGILMSLNIMSINGFSTAIHFAIHGMFKTIV